MAEIAKKYLKSTFFTDILSLLPKVFKWGTKLYFLKGIRLLHFLKETYKFEDVISWLRNNYGIHHYEQTRKYILV